MNGSLERAWIRSLLLGALQIPLIALASTGVGHGDVLDQFVVTTRAHFVTALKQMQSEGFDHVCDCRPEDEKTPPCQLLQTLDGLQKDFCSRFLRDTAGSLLQLNGGEHPTALILQSKPMTALDPSGHSRPVAAMTELGPNGAIYLHYGAVQLMSPSLMLSLIGHEFGHKVKSPELASFVDDNAVTGPFANPEGGGRALLDSVGAALAHFAYQHHLIGESYGLQDLFSCKIHEAISNLTFSSTQRSYRSFQVHTLDSYESGIGNSPEEDYCEIDEGDTGSRLFFRVKVHEENGCRKTTRKDSRWTLLELWQIPREEGAAPLKVNSRFIVDMNPLCAKPNAIALTLSYEKTNERKYQFQLTYQGSVVKSGSRKAGQPNSKY